MLNKNKYNFSFYNQIVNKIRKYENKKKDKNKINKKQNK